MTSRSRAEGFDPFLLAHADKFYLDPARYKAVFRPAADVAAVVVSGGRVIGTWRAERGRVAPELFAPVEGSVASELEPEVEAVSSWLRQEAQARYL